MNPTLQILQYIKVLGRMPGHVSDVSLLQTGHPTLGRGDKGVSPLGRKFS
jgi:hypothetical protein